METELKLKDLEEQAEQSATAVQKIAVSVEKMKTLGDNISSVGTNTSGCRDTLAEYGVTVYDAEGNVQSLSSMKNGDREENLLSSPFC
ncbi:MAG: hypothetical protein LUI87_20060 [Lachnospiraceae bacterium]|nr:hypothetical protein [Lachnospiraceae bacterium]